MRIRTTLPIVLALMAGLPAQEFVLSRSDGSQTKGQLLGLRGSGAEQRLGFAVVGAKLEVPWTEILALHGPSPRVVAPVAVHLVGGDEWKGVITGGDDEGETLSLETVFGRVSVPLDRLQTLVFRDRAKTRGAEDLRIAGSDDFREAVFLEAGRGLDVQGGEIERFGERGLYFVRADEEVAKLFRYTKLVGLAISEGGVAEKPGDWSLLTTAGDRLRVALLEVSADKIKVRTEFAVVELPTTGVAALTRLAGARVFLSDLEPLRVAEFGSDAEFGAEPLYSYRRDRTVSGGVLLERRSPADGFLVAGGLSYGKGLGVHSRCTLTYRVPPGMTGFHARVAIDDEVKSLGVKGDADVRVRVGARVLWSCQGLRRGQPAKNLGVLKVQPGTLLSLEVEFGKGLFLGDRVDWLSAVFLR